MVAVNMRQEACQRRRLRQMYAEEVDANAREFTDNAIEGRHGEIVLCNGQSFSFQSSTYSTVYRDLC